jgi:hypothetical protein
VFNFLSHKGNTNQSYTRISSHPSQIDHHPKKPKNNKCWSGCREKETFIHCRWECELVYPLWKSVCRFLKKLKIDLSYNPTIAVLGIYPRECKSIYKRDTCIPMFITALLKIGKL